MLLQRLCGYDGGYATAARRLCGGYAVATRWLCYVARPGGGYRCGGNGYMLLRWLDAMPCTDRRGMHCDARAHLRAELRRRGAHYSSITAVSPKCAVAPPAGFWVK
jgi:hypothetical protein